MMLVALVMTRPNSPLAIPGTAATVCLVLAPAMQGVAVIEKETAASGCPDAATRGAAATGSPVAAAATGRAMASRAPSRVSAPVPPGVGRRMN